MRLGFPRSWLAAALVAAGVFTAGPATGAGALPGQADPSCDGSVEAPEPRFVVDDCGRVVILRGTNVESSAKGGTQSDDHFPQSERALQEHFTDWGWNSVRFLVFWGAIEPEPGVYDEAYLNRVEEWLDFYESRHIHVVLDLHQDLYGWKVGGNGAPDWAVDTDGLTFEGLSGPWYLSALDPATQAAYQNFWDLSRGHNFREHYLAMLRHLAQRFADHPAVIGYDVMNEPVFANGDIDATLAIQADAAAGRFNNTNLTEFMQQAIDAVRSVDGNNWIGVAPTSLINAFPYAGDLLEDQLHDPRPAGPRLMYTGHLYEPTVHDGGGYSTESKYLAEWEQFRTAEAATMKASLWFGEWGGTSEQPRMVDYIREVTAMSDRTMSGWAHWSWDPSGDETGWSALTSAGNLTTNGRALVRVQPRAVAGTPVSFSWDPATLVFQMRWNERPEVVGPTEVALPAALYPQGFEIRMEEGPGWRSSFDPDTNVLLVDPDRSRSDHLVCVVPTGWTGECGNPARPPVPAPAPASPTGPGRPVPALPRFTG